MVQFRQSVWSLRGIAGRGGVGGGVPAYEWKEGKGDNGGVISKQQADCWKEIPKQQLLLRMHPPSKQATIYFLSRAHGHRGYAPTFGDRALESFRLEAS